MKMSEILKDGFNLSGSFEQKDKLKAEIWMKQTDI